jgi:hypothetical protein
MSGPRAIANSVPTFFASPLLALAEARAIPGDWLS